MASLAGSVRVGRGNSPEAKGRVPAPLSSITPMFHVFGFAGINGVAEKPGSLWIGYFLG